MARFRAPASESEQKLDNAETLENEILEAIVREFLMISLWREAQEIYVLYGWCIMG